MNISTALDIADSLDVKCGPGGQLTDAEWACRVLAGAYRRQIMVYDLHVRRDNNEQTDNRRS